MQFEGEEGIYDDPILSSQQYSLAQLSKDIVARGAKGNGKIYSIPTLTQSNRMTKGSSRLWSSTVELTSTADRGDLAYAAAAKNLDTCYIWLYSRFDMTSTLPYRSNLWSYLEANDHPERPTEGRYDAPLYISEVSIFLTTDGKFLEPRTIDVVTLSLDAGSVAELKAAILLAINHANNYDVVIFENGRDFVKPLVRQNNGTLRSVVLPL